MKRMPSEVLWQCLTRREPRGTLNETPNISRYSKSHFQQSENGHPGPLRLSTKASAYFLFSGLGTPGYLYLDCYDE